MDSQERGRRVAERVAHRIREVAPKGLGRWGPAWEHVAAPSDAFLDRLRAWERHDAPETREALQDAADDLVRAWRRADDAWDAAGRPEDAAPDALAEAHPAHT